ncbi:MAG: lysophospholipid acyltransferase family protein [candidate division KSB1 bacterium]|nr:lysophospholipid acyltransferase family protein [candidate division KSB1 bacterium]MDZ7304971.1 lysophospholipid acyltransferase family protein [candidate division KSB1 bacterium]MDZ7313996.1 lysophospholipid acyltransferase family protein [candidate division KSB1 bacterium]
MNSDNMTTSALLSAEQNGDTAPAFQENRITAKQPFKKRLLFWLATRLGWLIILLLGYLTRIRHVGREHFEWLRDNKKPFIYCIWHDKILIPIFVHRHENIHAMVSQHADGEMIAQTLHRLGYCTIRGSSTRGGQRAMVEMIRALKEGKICAIMPDGPKGPRHVFKPGAIAIAQKSRAYLLPFTFACSRPFVFKKSWDRFMIMLPFSTSVAIYGEPIAVPADLQAESFEDFRRRMEDRMNKLEEYADSFFKTRSTISRVSGLS